VRRSGAGFVLRRAGAQRVVLGAAFVTILLATTVLALTSMYVGSVTETALRRTLSEATPPDRTMALSVGVDTAQEVRTQDTRVRTALDRAFETVDTSVYGSAVSASYALPVDAGAEVKDLAVFASYQGLRDRANLVAGRWPAPAADGPIPVALSEPAARELDLQPGDTLRLVNRLTDQPASASVTGVYEVAEPESTYWLGDTLGTEGVQAGTSFTTYGPLVTDRQTFVDRLAEDATVHWRVDPALGELTVDDLSALQAGVAALTATELPEGVLVDSGLGELLESVEIPLLVGRSAVAMPSALLVLLAGYALFLTTRLLGEHRAGETALLRSRGVSSRQLLGHSVREALLLTVPAALAAPWLGALLLRGYDRFTPFVGEAARLSASPDATTWLVAGLAAVSAALVLVLPGWSSATTFVQTGQARGRHPARSAAQRAGFDLLLLGLAGLAYWQLARYGSPLLADVTGQLAIDPLLVLAPALVLVAAAVVALRLLPLVSAVAERVAARSRGAIAALGIWELSRRVRRHTGPALLLVLTTAIGTFSITYAAAWTGSQQDQADFLAGADLRLSELPDGTTEADVRDLPGVVDAMPAIRSTVRPGGLETELVALDVARADPVVELRDDLAATPLDELTDRLVDARPALPALPVPTAATTLDIPIQVRTVGDFDPAVQPAAVLADGNDVLHRVTFAERPADSGSRRLRMHLDRYADPVRLVAVQVRHAGAFVGGPGAPPVNDTLAVRFGPPVAVGTGPLTRSVTSNWNASFSDTTDIPPDVPALEVREDGTVVASLDPGCCEQVLFSFALSDPAADERAVSIPAVVSSDLAGTLGADTSNERYSFVVTTGSAELRLRVVGVVDGVPTAESGGSPAVVVDLPTLSAAMYQQTGSVPEVAEWWLAVDGDDTDSVVAAVEADDRLSGATVVDRLALGDELRADPVGSGILGALVIGSLAAATFAVIGFAVSISVSAGERRTELALLRAVGAGPRQLTRMLGIEQAVLVGIGLVVGSAIGVLVARLVVPLVTLTDQAVRPFPAVVVPLPWLRLAVFAAAVVGLLAVVLVGLTALLRRRVVTADLRLGEDV